MTESLTQYIWRNQQTFAECPLNPVDSLIFSTLSYLQYASTNLLPEGDCRILLHDVMALGDWEKLCSNSWMATSPVTDSFMKAIMASRRFRDVRATLFVEEFSETAEKQFGAITFIYSVEEGEQAYVAFRGTDGSVTGWREDFTLSYKTVIPSQQTALAYLSGVASAIGCPLVVGGHSKGGNIAEFAVLNCDDILFSRIRGIFNYDGPSSLGVPSPRAFDPVYCNLRRKYIPESSLFGMIMEQGSDYAVVRSSATGLRQHDPFSWLVDGDSFETQGDLNRFAALFSQALNKWTFQHTPEERERYISTIFSIVSAPSAQRFAEMKDNPLVALQKMATESADIDEADRRFMLDVTMDLAERFRDEVISDITSQGQGLNLFKHFDRQYRP